MIEQLLSALILAGVAYIVKVVHKLDKRLTVVEFKLHIRERNK